MRKSFTIITVLFVLFFGALIFYQVRWVNNRRQLKLREVSDNINRAMADAAIKLRQSGNSYQYPNRSQLPGSQAVLEGNSGSREQASPESKIRAIVQQSLQQFLGEEVPFEFALLRQSGDGGIMRSENFLHYARDTSMMDQHVIPLKEIAENTGQNAESGDYLMVIVPNEESLAMRQIYWFIAGGMLLNLITVLGFFLLIRLLVHRNKTSKARNNMQE